MGVRAPSYPRSTMMVQEPAPREWRRADGQVRLLHHLDGIPAAEPPETRRERFCLRLDGYVPGWDDHLALVGCGLLVLFVGLIMTLSWH